MAAAVVIAVFFSTVPAALAGPADIDPAFGTGGVAEVGQTGTRLRDVVATPDGKIITLSRYFSAPTPEFGFSRLNADGTADAGWATGGGASFWHNQSDDPHTYSAARGLALDPRNGDIVAVGWVQENLGDDYRATVVKLNADGTPDTTFDGDGAWYSPVVAGRDRKFFDVVVEPDGTIVAAGTSAETNASGFYVVRLGENGGAPLAGGIEDRKTSRDQDSEDGARELVRTTSGDIYIAGTLEASTVPTAVVAHLNPGGSFDTTFGAADDGYAVSLLAESHHARSIAVVGDKLWMSGHTDATPNELALLRFELDGDPDTTFGENGDGQRTFAIVAGRNNQFGNLYPAADGKLWAAAGVAGDGGSIKNQAVLARLMPDGSLDASFGGTGAVATAVDAGWPFVEGTHDPAAPFFDSEWESQGSDLHDVRVLPKGDKVLLGSTAVKTGSGDPYSALAQFGKADVQPPDPGTGSGGNGGGGDSSGGSSSPGGSSSGGGGAPPAPTGPTPPVVVTTPIVFVETTRAATMPDVRGKEMKAAIASLDKRFFADVTVKYTNEPGDHAKNIGDVAAQTPAPKAKITSAAGASRNVTLTIYEGPKPVGKHKCPEADLVKELKGLGPLYAEEVAKQLKCRIEVEVVPKSSAKDTTIGKVTAKNNKVVLTVNQPTKPEANELFLAFHGVRPQKSNATFNANDWSVPVGPLSSFGVTVMTRGGDLVKNANVTVDGTDVGGRDYSRMSGADGRGLAYLTVQPKKAGAVTVSARAEVGGQVLTGVGVINVKDTKGTFTTVNGENITLDSRGAIQKVTEPTVRAAGIADLWNQFLSAIGLGSPVAQQVSQPGRTPQQNLSSPQGKKTYPIQIALGQPLSGNAKAVPQRAADVAVIQSGKVGKARAAVIDLNRGNVIGASGILNHNNASIIGQASGNLIGPAAGNVITREIDLKRAKILSDNGLGLISDNGLGLISDNGLGILSDNGLGLISDNGLGLVPPKNGMLATSVNGVVSAGGAN
jgi:uncharacterized delta-60 repeat protein